jgi:Spy/CpxP family protein refolding chaperone
MTRSLALSGGARWWAAALLALAALGAARAQDPSGPPKEGAHPLPQHFDKLDLSDDQKQKVCAVMDEYDGKIEKLQAQIQRLRGKPYTINLIMAYGSQIKKLQAQRQTALENILDDDQRAKLKERRGG